MKKTKIRTQYAALPFSVRQDQTQVMLVTSRETRRWIIPKGWPEKDMQPHELAAREAYEEAGLVGRVQEKPFATFHYEKRLKSGRTTTCTVQTYLFEVERELDDWPEKHERERRWMSIDEAARLASDGALGEILKTLESRLPH